MKRRISVLTAILVLASFCSVCFAAGYSFMLSATSDVSNVSKGDTFSVSFYANSIADSKGILSITATAKYDPSQLRYKGVKGLVPESWGMTFFAEAFEAVEGASKVITINMAYDGNSGFDDVAVAEDNTLGFQLNFEVVTAAKGEASVDVLSEGLEATAVSDLSVLYGMGTSYSVSLNNVVEESSEESSYDPFYSIDDTVSYEEPVSIVEESSEEPSSEISIEESSSEEVTDETSEDPSANASEIVSEVSVEESSIESESTSGTEESEQSEESVANSAVSEESDASNGKDEGGLGVVFWIVIASVAVAIIAVAVYMVKFRKDDMNPVNPG